MRSSVQLAANVLDALGDQAVGDRTLDRLRHDRGRCGHCGFGSSRADVGNRLALWALDKTYGQKQVYSGPLFKGIKIAGDKAILSFAHAEGLKSRDGKPLSEFKVAGTDGTFVDAQAQIDGQTVVVSAEGVTPATVQFGWHKLANPNLVNSAGLPAAPFQSNNWQGGTGE